MSRWFWPPQAVGQAAMARSRMVSEGSGTIGLLGDLIDAAEAVAFGAGAFGGVGREGLGVEERLAARIVAGAGVEHAQKIGERRDAPTEERVVGAPRCCCRATAGGRPSMESTAGTAELVKEAAGVGRDGFEVAALRLRVERAEGERGFARAGDAREDHQRVARDVHVNVARLCSRAPRTRTMPSL